MADDKPQSDGMDAQGDVPARQTPYSPEGAGTRSLTSPTAQHGSAEPTVPAGHSWLAVAKRIGQQVKDDNLTVWAAALTYYAILSIFPALLVLISVLRLTGRDTTQKVIDNLTTIAPGPARNILTAAMTNLQQGAQSTAGILAIVGILGALWSASGYIGAFMQAANSIFDVPEGRPAWKKIPIRLSITIVAGAIVGIAALAVVFTGSLARQLGNILGVGSTAVSVWDIAKWPVLVLMIALLFAILYWAAPNAEHRGFRWITLGSLLAVLIWIAASAGFTVYVVNFSSYNKTYGSLAAIIIFLVWLWITNLAILVGAEFDAVMQRERAIKSGHPPDEEPHLAPRDTRKIDPNSNPDL